MKDDWILDFLRPFLPNWAGKAALALLVLLVVFVLATRLAGPHGLNS